MQNREKRFRWLFCGERCVNSFGLEATELFQRAVECALGGRASAVDGGLQAIEFFFSQILRRSNFDIGAAAQAPCGVDDFASEGLFERRVGRQFGEISGFELTEDVPLFGTDEVGDGKQPELSGILRNAGFACGRDSAMGPFGILPIGQDLSGAGRMSYCARSIAAASRTLSSNRCK